MSARPRKEIDMTTYTGRFAARLKMLREKAGLSVEELAESLGVTDQCIYDWEAARRQPKISDLPQISHAIGMKKAKDLLPNE